MENNSKSIKVKRTKKFTLSPNNIVELKNKKLGVVTSFNGEPSVIVFSNYCNPLKKYSEELKNKNEDYDIVRVYDGSSVPSLDSVFKSKFNTDELPLLWEGNGGRIS